MIEPETTFTSRQTVDALVGMLMLASLPVMMGVYIYNPSDKLALMTPKGRGR